MSADPKAERDEWRLGVEPGERHDAGASVAAVPARRELAHEGLERPVMLITVERLYWAIIAIYAVAARCAFLGSRPLGRSEARNALAAYDTMRLGVMPGQPAAWIQLLNAAVLGAFGVSDFTARLLFAISGIALVLIALAFRRSIGRTGALAMATMVALSPSITFFARSAMTQGPALLLALIVIAALIAIGRRVTTGRITALGFVIGLALSADAQNLVVSVIFALGLAALGIARLTTTDAVWVQTRIWWQRRSGMLLLAVLFALLVWAIALSGFFSHPLFPALLRTARLNWIGAAARVSALRLCLASFAFYEFLIVIAAIIGAIAVLLNLAGARNPMGAFVLIWAAAAAAFFMITPAFAPAWIVEILVPAAALGAIGIEALSRTRSWSVMFYPLAALALATLYIQIATNFVIVAPDPTEAPWARHALLFWSEPTTAAGAREAIQDAIGAGAERARTAWIADDSAVLRWYLRDLRPADTAAGAELIAGTSEAPPGWPIGARRSFDLESWWQPSFRDLSARRVIRFMLIGRAWEKLESREMTVLTRASTHPTPTIIYAPALPSSSSPQSIATAASPQPTP
jgi:uncharacterized protein (TIGR03663 family)